MPTSRISQRISEAAILPDGQVRISQRVVEGLIPYTAPSPTTPTGAGVSQQIVEAVFLNTSPVGRVSQRVVEIVFSAASTGESGAPGGGGGTVSFGFVT
jgi:hypothetical protein